jgi:hypothetical protein
MYLEDDNVKCFKTKISNNTIVSDTLYEHRDLGENALTDLFNEPVLQLCAVKLTFMVEYKEGM